jgi:hypothetical protein
MNFAEADPNATANPIVNGSALVTAAAFEAMKRFDGPAKGIMLSRKDVVRMVRTSRMYSSPVRLEPFVNKSN